MNRRRSDNEFGAYDAIIRSYAEQISRGVTKQVYSITEVKNIMVYQPEINVHYDQKKGTYHLSLKK